MKIFSISRWIEKRKEKRVLSAYYKLHENIFTIATCAELSCYYDVVDAFFDQYAGYVDKDLLTELSNALIKSVHVRAKRLVAEKRAAEVSVRF